MSGKSFCVRSWLGLAALIGLCWALGCAVPPAAMKPGAPTSGTAPAVHDIHAVTGSITQLSAAVGPPDETISPWIALANQRSITNSKPEPGSIPQVWKRDKQRPTVARVYVGDNTSLEL